MKKLELVVKRVSAKPSYTIGHLYVNGTLLCDTLEDTDTKFDELVSEFGLRVANLVAEESEDKQEGKTPEDTWKARKQATLDHLENAGYETKMIVLADKLANIRAIQRDLKA